MLGRIAFCVVIATAVLAVVLLATVSPLPKRSSGRQKNPAAPNTRTFAVYIQPTLPSTEQQLQQEQRRRRQEASNTSALVFQHRMTAGPERASRTVGTASGFVLRAEGASVPSVFDTVHLAFDAAGVSGSLCIQAAPAHREEKRRRGSGEEPLRVVGGTGAFAFAHGHAVVRAVPERRFAARAATVLQLELSVKFAES